MTPVPNFLSQKNPTRFIAPDRGAEKLQAANERMLLRLLMSRLFEMPFIKCAVTAQCAQLDRRRNQACCRGCAQSAPICHGRTLVFMTLVLTGLRFSFLCFPKNNGQG